ncbi:Manganese ABC transporter, ATP-binding protein SitB [Candidatus Syntrophocurvum alkaliphilum]|uniref:Manganese ABC transporter, ATP-binding protein SitB n=1 Tax=Candidatus Syntrophocurvum alkaliphilum TaxID=2293317 RepID=A0A6I6D979_9FIRM|nr:metal ABC transporter ATP-binding protein [Candidatus Syntrophocurvum alkaliphilum]QGT99405.1 Manganese ABC transporter, ATP-binding protein SitB [Candidatus Syntrophocurvum alkaliphilum]
MGTDIVLQVEDLSVSYGRKKAFENITFSINSNQLIGIIGPNGAGKSTLIKAILGLVQVSKGKVKVFDKPVSKSRKKLAYVPQRSSIDFDFPVLVSDVVMMGRYPHISWWGFPSKNDKDIVNKSLKQVEMYEYKNRQIGQLSGGQQQRVFLARALAQEAQVFFMDEPFAGIDIASESLIIDILRNLKNEGKTLFVVHHDLNKAESYFDSLILLKNKLIACGKKEEVFKLECLCEAYDGKITFLGGDNTGLMVVNG